MPTRQSTRRTVIIGRWIAAATTAVIAVATLVPESGGRNVTHWCLICGPLSGVDALLNILLFAPLGVGLALAGVRARSAILAMCCLSVAIEAAQLFVVAGRHASISDIVTNTVGGFLGFVAAWHRHALIRPTPAVAGRLAAIWLVIWIAAQFVIAFALLPAPSAPPYYCLISRPHWRTGAVYPGNVVSVSMAGARMHAGEQPDGAHLQLLLRDGASVQATIDPANPPTWRAEIVVLAGAGSGETSLEQEGRDLIFSIRNGADVLLLRPLEFRWRDVFPSSGASGLDDTIQVSGAYGRTLVELRTTFRGVERRWQFVPRLSYGWVLLAPFQPQLHGGADEAIAAALFMALLPLPTGYWGRRSTTLPRSRPGTLRLMSLVAALAVGLVAVPLMLGLLPATPIEWIYCIVGVGMGWVIALRGSARRPEIEADPAFSAR